MNNIQKKIIAIVEHETDYVTYKQNLANDILSGYLRSESDTDLITFVRAYLMAKKMHTDAKKTIRSGYEY